MGSLEENISELTMFFTTKKTSPSSVLCYATIQHHSSLLCCISRCYIVRLHLPKENIAIWISLLAGTLQRQKKTFTASVTSGRWTTAMQEDCKSGLSITKSDLEGQRTYWESNRASMHTCHQSRVAAVNTHKGGVSFLPPWKQLCRHAQNVGWVRENCSCCEMGDLEGKVESVQLQWMHLGSD